MGWRSFLIGFATLVAYCVGFGAWAQSTSNTAASAPSSASKDTREITEVQLPKRVASAAASDGTYQPRYSTQTPPQHEETLGGPVAAPTAKVSVAPTEATTQPQPLSQPVPQKAVVQQPVPAAPQDGPPRYARTTDPERITVTGLRPSEDSLYRLGPGDKVRVTTFNEGDLSGDFTVDGQGFVRLPLLGQIQAAGITSFGLESRISEALIGGGYLLTPRVSVEIISYRPFYILGEISKPGEYPYVNAMSAPNAIALAGGYTDRAVQSSIFIRRLGEKGEREYPADDTTRINPGDIVRVDRSTYWTIMTWLSPIISPFATVAYLLK